MRRALSCFSLLVSLFFGAEAFAEPTKADLKKAAEFFNKAETHYNLQEYEAALEAYKESYRLSLAPEILFNIGQCYRLLGRKEEAIRSYRAFLKEVDDPKTKEKIEILIKEMEAPEPGPETPPTPLPDPPKTQPVSTPPKEEPRTTPALNPNPPKDEAPKEAKLPRTPLYIAAGTGAGGIIFGIVSLQASAVSRQREAELDLAQAAAKRNKAVGTGLLADVMFAASIGSTTYAFLTKKKAQKAQAPQKTSNDAVVTAP